MRLNFLEFVVRHMYLYIFLLVSNVSLMVYGNIVYDSKYFGGLKSVLFSGLFFLFCFLIFHFAYKFIDRVENTNLKNILWGGVNIILCLSLIFYTISFIINYFLLDTFHIILNIYIIDSILRTNTVEFLEFLQVYIKFNHIIIVVVYLLCLFLSLKFKIYKKMKYGLNFTILLIVIVFVVNAFHRDLNKEMKETRLYHSINFVSFLYDGFFEKTNFEIFDYKIASVHYKQTYLSSEKLKANNDIKNIILILGESTSRNHFGLYSGFLPNTPNLKNLEKSGNIVIFNDVIAPYSTTNPVMSFLLNFANYENFKKPYNNLDVISLFKLASFKTFFISNQGNGYHDNAAFSVSLQSDFSWFSENNLGQDPYWVKYNPDEVLLPVLSKLEFSDNNFIVIHLLGTHFEYNKRYTKNFNKWGKNDIKIEEFDKLKDEHKQILAEYYNAILYNDYIIKSIYDIFSSEDSIYIYLSDHGEAVFDDKTKSILGHSLKDKTNAEIPFFIMYSDVFKNKHSELVKLIKKSVDKPYMTDDLIHTLCDIAGIYPKEYDSKRSIINENFNEKRKRMFMGINGVDYDKDMK